MRAALLGFILLLSLGRLPAAEPAAPMREAAHVFQCPMHPWIKSDHTGKCTVCGMDLVELAATTNTPEGVIALPASSITAIGVETTTVARQPLLRTVRVNGRIEDDDTSHRILSARVPGRVEKLFVNYVGAAVEANAPLATIWSPEMLTAQRVFVERTKSGDAAFTGSERAAAREMLQQLGLSPTDLAELEKSLAPSPYVTVRAPGAGTVVAKSVYEGQYVQASDRLFEIADFSRMWFVFEAYEQDIPWIKIGQQIEITSRSVPGEVIHTTVEFIDPNFSEASRTTRVRATLPNPHFSVNGEPHRLPHRVLAEGVVLVESPAVLAAPRSAVLDSGRGPVAYVALGNGQFEQRALKLGRRGDALVEVLAGLKESEAVVTTGALLLDAQAQLTREAAGNRPDGRAGPLGPPKMSEGAPSGRALPTDKFSVLAAAALDAADALASDDFARYQKIFPSLAPASAAFPTLPKLVLGDALKSARRSFEPWSTAVADLLKPQRAQLGLKVFQCPMSPVLGKGRWVQRSQPIKNPFFGAAMPDCGEEVP
jgi:Cu(I)/Ag(I) efflux system membrane fusion protein